MTRRFSLRPLVALALFPALALGSVQAAPVGSSVASASPKSVAITKADVTRAYGPGYTKVIGMELSNKDLAAPGGAPSLSSAGRVTGYVTEFIGSQGTALIVANGVNLYHSSTQARAAINSVFTHFPLGNLKNKTKNARLSHYSGVGEAAFLLTFSQTGTTGGTAGGLMLGFSRGAYAVDFYIAGRGKVDLSRALSLAKTLDQRIQHS